MGYIYKITNDINGKIYIGKTEHVNPEDRWREHLKDYKKERCEKRPIYEAMKKYGTEHFHFEVIEETDSIEERETYWINELRTYVGFEECNGYNATLGGDGKSYLNLDEYEVIDYHTNIACYSSSYTAKYFNVTSKTILKILNKHNIPWVRSNSTNKMRFYLKNGEVVQVNKNNKLIINRFVNATEASASLNKSQENITQACLGRRKIDPHYAYGYLWYYGKDIPQAIKNGEVIDVGI